MLQKIKQSLNIFKAEPEPTTAQSFPTGYEVRGFSSELSSKKEIYLKELKGWVGACTTSIADEIAKIQIKLYKWSEKGGVEEITNHDILDLLYRVNDYTTKFDQFWLTQAYLELTGESPWFIEKKNGKPKNIYFLSPDRLTPLVDKESRLISGYKYRVGSQDEITLRLEDVVFLKYNDPANPFRGIGTLQQAARIVDIDNSSEKWNYTFYENSARPDSVLTVNVPQMQADQMDKLKKSIKKTYQGTKEAHKTMVLFGDMKWDTVGMNQKDMDFLEQQKFSRDKICGIFRVPKSIIAQTDGINFASAKVGQDVFDRNTIDPKMERLVQQLNEFLLPLFKGTENMFLDYVSPIKEDQEFKLKFNNEGLNKFLTINEVRDAYGLSNLKAGGDSIYIPMNVLPVGESGEKKHLKLDVKICKKEVKVNHKIERIRQMKAMNRDWLNLETIKEDVRDKVRDHLKKQIKISSIKPKNKNIKAPITAERKLEFWNKKDALTDKYTPEIKKIMIEIFREQRKKTIIKFNQFKSWKLDPNTVYNAVKLNIKDETAITVGLTLPILEQLFKEAGDEAYALLDLDREMDISREEIQKLMEEKAKLFATATITYTNEKIKKIIVDGLAKGRTVNELQLDVRQLFIDSENYRADRIARTETVRYNTSASEQAYIDSGIVKYKEWFVHPGACEFCQPLQGKKINLGKTFFKEGDMAQGNEGGKMELNYEDILSPPLHVNCRCDLVPVFE